MVGGRGHNGADYVVVGGDGTLMSVLMMVVKAMVVLVLQRMAIVLAVK